jgi:hypothetical protein
LVKSEKLDEATMEQFRQQLLLREWEKSVRSRLQADFQATGVQISPSRSIVVFRQNGIVTMAEIRHSHRQAESLQSQVYCAEIEAGKGRES